MGYGDGGIKAVIAFLGAMLGLVLAFLGNLFGVDLDVANLASIDLSGVKNSLPFMK